MDGGMIIFAIIMATHFHPLKIDNIVRLTDECVEVQFEINEELKDSFAFIPGQYLTLKSTINGEEVRRSYSICSCPDDNHVSIAIKKVDQGKFSTYANEQFQIGDIVESMEPMGTFTVKKCTEKNHFLFIAAGSGITPVISIIETLLKKDPAAHITLIYGNKNRSSIIFKDRIEGLKNQYMNRMVVYHVFSREMADTQLFNGRINGDKMSDFGKILINYNNLAEVFICGPEEMILSARDYFLNQAGLTPQQIHFELFASPDQPRVASEEWKKKLETLDTTQKSNVIVHLDGVAFNMELEYGGETILDAALKNGADLPYACKGGVCATCKAKLIKGDVDMEVNYSLEPDELANNFILTCQAHPRSENVEVDFDIK